MSVNFGESEAGMGKLHYLGTPKILFWKAPISKETNIGDALSYHVDAEVHMEIVYCNI